MTKELFLCPACVNDQIKDDGPRSLCDEIYDLHYHTCPVQLCEHHKKGNRNYFIEIKQALESTKPYLTK